MGVFDAYMSQSWPIEFEGTIRVRTLVGGTPADEKQAIRWVESKLKDTRSKDEIGDLVARTMVEMKLTQQEATKHVALKELAGLNGFKSDSTGLYVEGRHLKAALKEGVNIAIASSKLAGGRAWGATHKGLNGFFPEHVHVVDDLLYLRRNGQRITEPDGTFQRFVHTFRGDAITYEQYCENVDLDFTIRTDHKFSKKDWAMIWTTSQENGIGASRSQGFGKYEVVRWEQVKGKPDSE
jgi:hypothetical protein